MKINSMKLTIIIMLAFMVSGVVVGLFYKEIPAGNREAALIVLGTLISELGHAIADMFKKGA
jgi:hypothetical protein